MKDQPIKINLITGLGETAENIKLLKEKYKELFSNNRRTKEVIERKPNILPIKLNEVFKAAGVKYNPFHRFRYVLFEDLVDNGISTEIAKSFRINAERLLPLEKLWLYIPPDASPSYPRHISNRARRAILNRLLGIGIATLQEELIKEQHLIKMRNITNIGAYLLACKYRHRINESTDLTIGVVYQTGRSLVLYNQTRSTCNWKRAHLHNLNTYPHIQPPNQR
jgi:hypothetical protein